MSRRTIRVAGAAPVELAWQRYAELSRWPEWSPQITSVDSSAERIADGVSGTIHAGSVALDFEITAVDEAAMTWSWTIRRSPLTLKLDHTVSAEGEGSATSLTVDGPLLIVMAYVPIATVALTKLVTP